MGNLIYEIMRSRSSELICQAVADGYDFHILSTKFRQAFRKLARETVL